MANKDQIKMLLLKVIEDRVKESHHAISYKLWETSDEYAKVLNVKPGDLPVKLGIMRIWKKLDMIAGQLTRLHRQIQEIRTGTAEPM